MTAVRYNGPHTSVTFYGSDGVSYTCPKGSQVTVPDDTAILLFSEGTFTAPDGSTPGYTPPTNPVLEEVVLLNGQLVKAGDHTPITPPATTTVPDWAANTAYAANQVVRAPDTTLVRANAAFTSGSSYNGTNWTALGSAGTKPSLLIAPGNQLAPIFKTRIPSYISNGTDIAKNTRVWYPINSAVRTVRLAFVNWYTQGLTGPTSVADTATGNTITLTAAIETVGGKLWRCHVAGVKTINLDTIGFCITDPLDIDVALADGGFWVRTYVSVASAGMKWPEHGDDGTTASVTTYTTSPTDLTSSTGALATAWVPGTTTGFQPVAILTPGTAKHLVTVVGDSIAHGSGDPTLDNSGIVGFIRRALNPVGVPFLALARGNSRVLDDATPLNRYRRWSLPQGATDVIVSEAINDLTGGRTFAQVQADYQTVLASLKARGMTVTACTVAPHTTSTDSWATTVNQTVDSASNPARTQFNDWLRTMPSGIDHLWEVADAVETARNSGIWKASYTGDGTHPNATGHAAMAAAVSTAHLVN